MKLVVCLLSCLSLFSLGRVNGMESQTYLSVSDSVENLYPLPSQLSLQIGLECASKFKEMFQIYKGIWGAGAIKESSEIDANMNLITQKIDALLKEQKENFMDFQLNYDQDVNEIILILADTSLLLQKENRTGMDLEEYYIQLIINELTNPIRIEVKLSALPGITALKKAKESLEPARRKNKVHMYYRKPDIYFSTVLVILDKGIKQIEIFPELYESEKYYREAMQYAAETLEVLIYHLEHPIFGEYGMANVPTQIHTAVCKALNFLKSDQ